MFGSTVIGLLDGAQRTNDHRLGLLQQGFRGVSTAAGEAMPAIVMPA
jgi:hypothetical protein